MDTHVKEGQLHVQHQKFGKKWKKNWFVLYPASQNGIARLEFFDSPSGAGAGSGGGGGGGGTNEKTRKLDKKIIRLSECISILPAVTETCPKENMAAFCVETVDKTHVFAAEKSVTAQWVEIMCDIAFQGGGGSKAPDCNGGPQDLQMSENLIYYSREEVNEFWVSVQRTEASERCSLSGSYWLKAERDSLVLKEAKTKRNVLVWPYKLLRRYGRDRVMFSFEAGRRCDSGPGNFTFETKQGNEIFQLVEQAIKSQKALAEERHLSCPITFDPDCPPSLQYLRSMAGIVLEGNNVGREPDGDSGGSKPGSADGVIGRREGGDGGGGGGRVPGGLHKGRSLPDPPPMMGVLGGEVTPPKSPRHGAVGVGKFPVEEQSGVYSEPADSVRLPPPSADGLYSDPVDSIKNQNQPGSISSGPTATPRLRPVGDEGLGGGNSNQRRQSAEQVYSYLYDQVDFDLSQRTGSLGLLDSDGTGGSRGGNSNSNRRPPGGQAEGASSSPVPPTSGVEHIYDEPEGCAKPRAAPPVMSIYDEACPEGWRRLEEAALASGQEGNYNQENSYSIPSAGKQYTQPYTTQLSPPHTTHSSEPRAHSPPHSTPNRGPPTAPRWAKPTTAPKPGKGALPRKDLLPPPPVRPGGSVVVGNVNNNNGNTTSGRDLYSKVSKIKVPPPNLWFNQQTNNQPVLRSPDIIYDNLGDV